MNLTDIKEFILNETKDYMEKVNPKKELELIDYEKENGNRFYLLDRIYVLDIKFDYPELIRILNDKLKRRFNCIIRRYRDGVYEIVREDNNDY